MSRYRILLVIALFSVCSSLLPHGAQAQSDIPLMVVRYNQAHIYYDKQLYSAVSKAVAIKPEVTFSLVSFVPSSGGEAMDAAATAQTNAFVGRLQNMGIPAAHIHVTKQNVADSQYHEIYLYVD